MIFFHFTEISCFWIRNETCVRPVFASFPSRKLRDPLESISLERCGSYLFFNRELTSSSCGTKGSTSLAHDSIDVSITSKGDTFKISCPNDNHNFHSTVEQPFETSIIDDFDPNSYDCHDPSGN